MSITKVFSRKVEKDRTYATVEDLIEELHILEKRMNWSIFNILDILKRKKADSFSMTKEKPFHYLYARLSEKTIIIRLQTKEQETEFRLPIETLKK